MKYGRTHWNLIELTEKLESKFNDDIFIRDLLEYRLKSTTCELVFSFKYQSIIDADCYVIPMGKEDIESERLELNPTDLVELPAIPQNNPKKVYLLDEQQGSRYNWIDKSLKKNLSSKVYIEFPTECIVTINQKICELKGAIKTSDSPSSRHDFIFRKNGTLTAKNREKPLTYRIPTVVTCDNILVSVGTANEYFGFNDGVSDWDWFPKINPNDEKSTDQNNKGAASTSHRKLTETEVEEIDNYFEPYLSRNPPLEKLIDTTLYYEKTYINNNISEILDDWYSYIKKVNYDDKECFEYWIRCPFPSLIVQALRYLQFICQKESIRFNRIRNSILIGDTKALYDHAESLDYIYYPILKLISICWDALTLPQEYTKQSERKILEILTDVSERTAEYRLADFEINEPKKEKEFNRIKKESEKLKDALQIVKEMLQRNKKNEIDTHNHNKQSENQKRMEKLNQWLKKQSKNFDAFDHDLTKLEVWNNAEIDINQVSNSTMRRFFSEASHIITFKSGRRKNR